MNQLELWQKAQEITTARDFNRLKELHLIIIQLRAYPQEMARQFAYNGE